MLITASHLGWNGEGHTRNHAGAAHTIDTVMRLRRLSARIEIRPDCYLFGGEVVVVVREGALGLP